MASPILSIPRLYYKLIRFSLLVVVMSNVVMSPTHPYFSNSHFFFNVKSVLTNIALEKKNDTA